MKAVKNNLSTLRGNIGFVDFDYLRIKIASPEQILSWSYGEVKNADTVNYLTLKPERDGLFCARIFGPIKDYECLCGKYRKMKYKGIHCEKCDVDVVSSKVRRERMGHIQLVYPVVNTLYLNPVNSKISSLLNLTNNEIRSVLFFESYIVIDAGLTNFKKYQTISIEEYNEAVDKYGVTAFNAKNGAEGIKQALESFDLEKEYENINKMINSVTSKVKLAFLKKRANIINAFIVSGNRPEWMVFTVLPVLPPELRPLVKLSGGRVATSDLNTLYARIIYNNNRLKKMMEIDAPAEIIQHECRMLQESVSALLNNSGSGNVGASKDSLGRPLKSISDFLKGKEGRLRQNLLGKRVDYSGRSVIVSGPELKMHQCGLPKEMALELFKPFVLSKLHLYGLATTIKKGLLMIDEKVPEVWEALEEVVKEHPVLLNRAPTLHRLGIQAFEPKLIELKAIQLHPLVCRAFNADFDGDQMAVHIPLSIEAQLEARVLMLSTNNILSSADGKPIIVPRKDITVGLYYMTTIFNDAKGKDHVFYSYDDVMIALNNNSITINTSIKYYYRYDDLDGEGGEKLYCLEQTTAGRIKLLSYIPHDNKISFDYFNKQWSIGFLSEAVKKIYDVYGAKITVIFCDRIMKDGFRYATLSGISFGKDDIQVPDDKYEVINSVFEKIREVNQQYNEGYITTKERYNRVTDYWSECTDELCEEVMSSLKKNADNSHINSIALMMNSGARASKTQMKQLAGMKGLIAKPNGEIIETPVTSNFKEGLSVMEYFNAAHGARKGNVDTALKTADAGYLTRRLVDVAQDCIIVENDCGSCEGVKYRVKIQDGHIVQKLSEIIKGRFLASDVLSSDGKVLLKNDTFIDADAIKVLDDNCITEALVRSPVTCKCKYGICSKCYGIDLTTQRVVNVGEAVGVIAAQTIGEPGTQLTLNTFHIGGVATKKITESIVDAEAEGKICFNGIEFVVNKNGEKIVISNSGRIEIVSKVGNVVFSKLVGYSAKLMVSDGDDVKLGQRLAEWDPYNVYIISEYDGKVRFNDMILNTSYIDVADEALGHVNKFVINWVGNSKSLRPSICIEDKNGKRVKDTHGLEVNYLLSVGTVLSLSDGDEVCVGDRLAKIPRDSSNVVSDITGGLPRVEELFEARNPANSAIIAGADGYIEFGKETKGVLKITLHPDNPNVEDIIYNVPKGKYVSVRNGGVVKNGDIIVAGSMNLRDILKYQGVGAVTAYIVREIQAVYKLQGIDVDSKHIEVIVKYMLSKAVVDDKGDTDLCDEYQYELTKILEKNEQAVKENKQPAKFHRVLYGISKASLQTESFISAASFQETVNVLVDAAVKGKKDELRGMKESMIIGRLMPAGTGFVTRKLKHKAMQIAGENGSTIDIDSL